MSSTTIFQHDFTGKKPNPDALSLADAPPPWRKLSGAGPASRERPRKARPIEERQAERGRTYQTDPYEARLVNAALMLRRPLLITGPAGVGKTSLAYAVAWQLGLGNVLRWGITSRSTLKDGLYHYDALARLHDASLFEKKVARKPIEIGSYLTLGPLGTALQPSGTKGYFPRLLLIDEIDKSDADFPNDLLHVLEEGSFSIPEIARLPASMKGKTIPVRAADDGDDQASISADGVVRCDDFPLIIMTSNGERDFPPAFLRRCLRLEMERPKGRRLQQLVQAYLDVSANDAVAQALLKRFEDAPKDVVIATDQLLNALFIARSPLPMTEEERKTLLDALLRALNETQPAG